MLSVTGLRKVYGRVPAVDGVDLDVPAGTLTAVLGPSGCGKTTLLRCVAGFERVDAGAITLAGRPITGVPAHRRRIAVVPQEGALFPHLSVAGNVGYGLDRAERRSGRVEEVLALVGLDGYGARMPHQLSGGQQQRVAVARALAPRPPLVLLDEPFSALDAALRTELRRDVRQALHADGATAVLVTHDQAEALSIADQVAVMNAGRIEQSGPPTTVYQQPANPWVATFVGEAVLLPGTTHGATVETALGRLPLQNPAADPARRTTTVLVRPEQIDLHTDGSGVTATVLRHDFHGHDALVALRLHDGTEVSARVNNGAGALGVGRQVGVAVRGTARAFDPAT
ncbi:ABC transporter ATP-binding protein [Dactylosporangium sp. AC04546]|uniref:ABC transporter ATP-binding protein n=1 Tax=Dactylosporangium sp. AC04546 TaxID=2862460 RepID=UPI001EE0B5E4|nr:ABC transporter ATP-binding protein [Dactylosporangium sp. AC04546]WVK89644.1 ABC transporter ATP-binding protein [Dactylosporangium sp. AC04546]